MKNKFKLILAFICLIIVSCKKPEGTLSGVVTYISYDKNAPTLIKDNPDVGANIHFVKKTDFDANKFDKISAFEYSMSTYSNIKTAMETMEAEKQANITNNIEQEESQIKDAWEDLKRDGINSDDDYSRLHDEIKKLLDEFILKTKGKSLVADGAGAFKINLETDEYYILFESSFKKGNFHTANVKIESGKEVPLNAKF